MTLKKLASTISALFIAVLCCGVMTACRPVLGGNGDAGMEAAEAVRLEFRLASDSWVEGWEKRVIEPYGFEIYIAPEARITNADIAQAWFQPRGEDFVIGLHLTEDGALKLAKLSGQNIGGKIAILINDKVVSAPRVMGQISDRAEIHGAFTEQEARDFAAALDPQSGEAER